MDDPVSVVLGGDAEFDLSDRVRIAIHDEQSNVFEVAREVLRDELASINVSTTSQERLEHLGGLLDRMSKTIDALWWSS